MRLQLLQTSRWWCELISGSNAITMSSNVSPYIVVTFLCIPGLLPAQTQIEPLPLDLTGLEFGARFIGTAGPQVIFASLDDGAVSTYHTVYARSLDGGATWDLDSIPDSAGRGIMSFFPLSEDVVWASLSNDISGAVWRTTDGGDNWTQMTQGEFSPGFVNFTYFTTPDSGVACGDPRLGYFEIQTTTDGGNTWLRTPQQNIPAPLPNEFGRADSYCAVGRTVWFNTNGRAFKSEDLGSTWSVVPLPNGAPSSRNIQFNDLLHGASHNVMSISPVYITNDGGETWTPRLFSPSVNIVAIAAIPGVPGAYLFTSQSPVKLNITLDHFQTYVVLDDEHPYGYQEFRITDAGTAYLPVPTIGSDSAIYKLSDIGTSIHPVAAGPGSFLHVFPNPVVTGHSVIIYEGEGDGQLMLFNARGDLLRTWPPHHAGKRAELLTVSDLPPGAYQLVLQAEEHRLTRTLIVAE